MNYLPFWSGQEINLQLLLKFLFFHQNKLTFRSTEVQWNRKSNPTLRLLSCSSCNLISDTVLARRRNTDFTWYWLNARFLNISLGASFVSFPAMLENQNLKPEQIVCLKSLSHWLESLSITLWWPFTETLKSKPRTMVFTGSAERAWRSLWVSRQSLISDSQSWEFVLLGNLLSPKSHW